MGYQGSGTRPIVNIPGVKGLIDGRPFGVVSVTEFGAKGDGVTDDTQAFLDALNAVSGGGEVRVPWTPNGYLVSGGITLSSNQALVGVGARPLLRLADGANYNVLQALNAENVRIENLAIEGNADNQNADLYPNVNYLMGIRLFNVDGLDMRNVHVSDTINVNIKMDTCTNLHVSNVHCKGARVDGWSISNCQFGSFVDVSVSDVLQETIITGNAHGFEIEDGSAHLTFSGVTVENCTDKGGMLLQAHNLDNPVHHVVIQGVRALNCSTALSITSRANHINISGVTTEYTRTGVRFQGCSEVSLSDFSFKDITVSGIYFLSGEASGVVISNGHILTDDNGSGVQIAAPSIKDVRLQNVRIVAGNQAVHTGSGGSIEGLFFNSCHLESTNNSAVWLRTPNGKGTTFSNCTVIASPGRTGFIVTGGWQDVSIIDTETHGAGTSAITVGAGCSNVTIRGGIITGATSRGVDVANGCHRVTFDGVRFKGLATAIRSSSTADERTQDVQVSNCRFEDVSTMVAWSGEQNHDTVTLIGNIRGGASYADPTNGTNIVKSGNNPELL